MTTTRKRLISLLLTLVMIFSLVPSSVFAEAGEGDPDVPANVEETLPPEETDPPASEPPAPPLVSANACIGTMATRSMTANRIDDILVNFVFIFISPSVVLGRSLGILRELYDCILSHVCAFVKVFLAKNVDFSSSKSTKNRRSFQKGAYIRGRNAEKPACGRGKIRSCRRRSRAPFPRPLSACQSPQVRSYIPR